MKTGKCGHCGKHAMSVKIEPIEAKVGAFGSGGGYNAVSYVCQSCNAILGVQMDPIALKTDIVNAVFEKLRKGR